MSAPWPAQPSTGVGREWLLRVGSGLPHIVKSGGFRSSHRCDADDARAGGCFVSHLVFDKLHIVCNLRNIVFDRFTPTRCSVRHRTLGGPGFLPGRQSRSLIISCKNSKNSGSAGLAEGCRTNLVGPSPGAGPAGRADLDPFFAPGLAIETVGDVSLAHGV